MCVCVCVCVCVDVGFNTNICSGCQLCFRTPGLAEIFIYERSASQHYTVELSSQGEALLPERTYPGQLTGDVQLTSNTKAQQRGLGSLPVQLECVYSSQSRWCLGDSCYNWRIEALYSGLSPYET